jgi:hypothetical protein
MRWIVVVTAVDDGAQAGQNVVCRRLEVMLLV